jgi:hypothetical protein
MCGHFGFVCSPARPTHSAKSRRILRLRAVALSFAYDNPCKIHLALQTTPAQAAGVDQSIWTLVDLIEACGE